MAELDPGLAEDLERILRIAGAITVTETMQEERLSVAAAAESGLVAFSAVGDTCPLCLALDGKIFRAGSREARIFTPPLHINCDCLWAEVGADEVGAQDRFTADDLRGLRDLVDQHGHFVHTPGKYQPLRVVAGPEGRDFTVRRVKDEAGNLVTTLTWHRPRYQLDLPPSPVTGAAPRQLGVVEVGDPWVAVALGSG